MSRLSTKFQPHLVTVTLPCTEGTISAAQVELSSKADVDPNKCWGYFPGMAKNSAIDDSLPASRDFAKSAPTITLNNLRLHFNFIRVSLVQQSSETPFHLDSDAATALTGDTATIDTREVWRLLLNLSDTHTRTLSYLDINPADIQLSVGEGYINCPKEFATQDVINNVVIRPRSGDKVHGLLFCSSRVLHTGKDDEHGHFVSGYGCEI